MNRLLGVAVVGFLGAAGCRPAAGHSWGVEVEGVRRSAGGYMLNFAYRVEDPQQARPLLDLQTEPYLVDLKSGARLHVPHPPKVGALRSHGSSTPNQRNYILFGNPGQTVNKGDRVAVVIGEFRTGDLVVE